MQTSELITAIEDEIARLQEARALLTGNGAQPTRRGPKSAQRATALSEGNNRAALPKKRTMSAAGRARIAAAQKARWAKLKKAGSGKK